MEKAKIMFVSIACFAVVGGVCAFKVHNAFQCALFCASTTTVLPVGTYGPSPFGVAKYCTFISTIKPKVIYTVAFCQSTPN
jgi:hypothetical protein